MLNWNIQPDTTKWVFIKGDTIDMLYRIYLNNGSNPAYPKNDPYYYHDCTGFQIDIHFRRMDGLVIKQLSSAGVAPEIIIAGSLIALYADGFDDYQLNRFDVQITEPSGKKYTIASAYAAVLDEVTEV